MIFHKSLHDGLYAISNARRYPGFARHPFECLEAVRQLADLADGKTGSSEKEQAVGRKWLASFGPSTIPRHLCEVTYSRASGPGGQNVNK